MQSVKKPMAWRIKPKKVNIDFTTPEQHQMKQQRLNSANQWLHRSLESDCLWGIVIAKQVHDAIENK
tara:strand:- start:585 stop:785 length:201 start_codon:yes stop_codon:yes gene_type:complete